jgi:hypothetical protein
MGAQWGEYLAKTFGIMKLFGFKNKISKYQHLRFPGSDCAKPRPRQADKPRGKQCGKKSNLFYIVSLLKHLYFLLFNSGHPGHVFLLWF